MAAVKFHGRALRWASDDLRNDKEFVLEVVKYVEDGHALKYTQSNTTWFACVHALKYAPKHWMNIKEFVLAAVTNNGYALQYASNKLKRDEDVVWAATRTSGVIVLRYAHEDFKKKILEYVS